MTLLPEDVLRLLLAAAAGGLIGAEREFRDKAAGFRTMILISVGAALFTMFSTKLGGASEPTRIAANVVSGIGFQGAGVILREGGRVVGLTTSSTIWLTAALGMGFGGGYYLLSGGATATILTILWIFPTLEGWIEKARETRIYEVVCPMDPDRPEKLAALFRECGLRVVYHKQAKRSDHRVSTWDAYGSARITTTL